MNCYIRSVEVIDRNLPDLAPLFDEMRDRLRDEHGITRARYYHAVPVADGARLAVSASPPIRALADDYVRNRRHEIDHLLLERMRLAEPTVWDRERRDEGCPPRMRATATALGVPHAGGHRRGLVARLRRCRLRPRRTARPLQDQRPARAAARPPLHGPGAARRCRTSTSPTATSSSRPRRGSGCAPGDQEALAGVAAGRKTDVIGYELGITGRGGRGAPGASAQDARLPDHHRGRRQGGGARTDPLDRFRVWDLPSTVEFPS